MTEAKIIRCPWAESSPLEMLYHDTEWGKEEHDDFRLFEFLILEGMQAGLSWATVLKKRAAFRAAFDDFDPQIVASYDEEKLATLREDKSIIRNRLKIKAAVQNAQGFLAIQKEWGSFDQYLWHFTEGRVVKNHWQSMTEVPVSTPLSERISKDLKQRGFNFVGPTIMYAYLQATGVVNDHLVSCHCYHE